MIEEKKMCFLITEVILFMVMLDFLPDLVSFTYRPHSTIREVLNEKLKSGIMLACINPSVTNIFLHLK